MFNSDNPINGKEQDILGRAGFANDLYKAIKGYVSNDSLVLGLHGEWGSGKSSIINLLFEAVDGDKGIEPNKKPIIVKFNPWHFTGQSHLIGQFFNKMSIVLKREDKSGQLRNAAKKIERLEKMIDPISLVPGASIYVVPFAERLRGLRKIVSGIADQTERDLDGIKEEINEILGKLDRKVLIVMDDLDRLSEDEIRQMFKLVISLADFKNTVYLLSFDQAVVVEALKKTQFDGQAYLEKIIQVPLVVPKMDSHLVMGYMKERINKIVNSDDLSVEIDFHMKEIDINIRDANRILNVFNLNFSSVSAEVNHSDLLWITVIQVLEPEIYKEIASNKELLVSSPRFSGNNPEDRKLWVEETIKKCRFFKPDYMESRLLGLFSQLMQRYVWEEKRIGNSRYFDLYFRLGLLSDQISRAEMRDIVATTNDIDKFAEQYRRLHEEKRLYDLFNRLRHEDWGLNNKKLEVVVKTIFRESDNFFDYYMTIDILNKISEEQIRGRVLIESLESLNELGTLAEVVHILVVTSERLELGERPVVSSNDLDKIKEIGLAKLKQAKDSGVLSYMVGGEDNMPFYLWRKLGGEVELQEFVKEQLADDNNLFRVLAKFNLIYKQISDVARENNFASMDLIYPSSILLPRAREIRTSEKFGSLSSEIKEAIGSYIKFVEKLEEQKKTLE